MNTAEPAALVEQHGHVLVITLNRPHAMNAVNADVSAVVGEALVRAEEDLEVRAVVLTGAGTRAFSAGADLKAVSRGEQVTDIRHPEWGFAGYVRHPISKPTIAAVNGYALAGGMELVLASDLALAAESATFGLPEVARGLLAGAGGVFRLPEQIPTKIAMELIFTGEAIDAPCALSLGLVNRVVPDGTVLDAALELAEKISRNAPLAVQASKRVATGQTDGTVPAESDAWLRNAQEVALVKASQDFKEGTSAFVEKRQPQWRAR
ncbi:crotonase/enoyl-CoA hydratase family protein [Streptomyces sp. NPDC051917]|uniref:crotonase/enoyl-CoA hydratase family protein n=1 Tax=Streptomyces sp. NPDC051917 TaxID=3154754 RepID=UPI003453ED93